MRRRGWIVWSVVATFSCGDVAVAAPNASGSGTDDESESASEPEPADEWGPDDEVEAAPEPAPVSPPSVATSTPPAPIVAPAPPPPPTSEERELRRKRKGAEAAAITGYVFAGLGGLTLLFLSLPAVAAASVARDRAEDDPVLVSESELNGRVERRERFARISALVGLGGLVVGGTLIGVGLGVRKRIDRDLQRLSAQRVQARVTPWLSPHAGALSLVVNF